MSENSWAIIRYAANSGATPADDCAAFDGWYFDHAEALAVYREWCEEHPHWTVGLVKAEDIRFSKSDWCKVTPHNISTICPLKRG